MPRIKRATQFAPFDALKGLQEALRLKEYEHDRVERGDLQEDKIQEISSTLSQLNNGDKIKVKYFCGGYYFDKIGFVILKLDEAKIVVDNLQIALEDICDIEKI